MAAPLPSPITYDPQQHHHLLSQVVNIHTACISTDNTLATFLPPLSHDKILASWSRWSSEVEAGTRVIFLQLASEAIDDGIEKVAGVVSLYCPETETGSHRGEVGRLLVSLESRHRGIARRLMEALEVKASERGRWLLVSDFFLYLVLIQIPDEVANAIKMLDTTIGSGAEHVYPRLGYQEVGVIPRYGFSPDDLRLRDEVFFYKDLKHGND